MNKVFLTILNMSLTGVFVIAATCLVYLPLKKAPESISTPFQQFTDAYNTTDEKNSPHSEISRLANIWANALKTRDGKPRYDMMSQEMKTKFIEEQKQRINSDTDWNYNIGVSSPWVVSYSIDVNGMVADILYLTTTSVPNIYYNDSETITFGYEDGKLVVIDSKINFEGRLYSVTK